MSRNHARLLLCVASSLFSFQVFAATPFTDNDLARIRLYMYKNFATKDNVYRKTDQDKMITSRPGAILASPSLKNDYGFSQDYQFHWVRDAGVTMRQVVNEYKQAAAAHQDISELNIKLQNYIDFEREAQQQFSNPGEQTLGQPKFNIDGTVWEGIWGRPQNDGPAIRALALCEMVGENMVSAHEVVPLIKIDLDYVVREWHQPNFDLWEEVNDTDHFFTKMMQQRALTCGGNLLYFTDHALSQKYTNASKEIKKSLDYHWNEKLGYITETINQLNNKGGGLDSAIVLGVLYGSDWSEAAYLPEWSVRDDRVMGTVAALRDAFAKEYPINQANPQEPPLIGRYPGDKYDGNQFVQGNPWVLTTVALAEYYYTLAHVYKNSHLPVEITQHNRRFFEQLNIKVLVATTYEYDTPEYNNVMTALIAEGDRYMQRINYHSACTWDYSCMHYAEQIDAKTGRQTSAEDLTWGYVSILRAMQARKFLVND